MLFICFPMDSCAASFAPVRVHMLMRSPLLRTFTTAPQISPGSANCSPISASSVFSQYVSSGARLLVFGQANVHLPPLAHLASSHLGSMPSYVCVGKRGRVRAGGERGEGCAALNKRRRAAP